MLRIWLCALAVAASALGAAPAPAASTIDVGYTISFWTLPFGHTEYRATFANGGYRAASHFQTGGFVSLFWHSIIDASASGKIGAHSLSPAVYDSWARNHRGKLQRVKVTYGGDVPETIAEPPYNTKKYPVTGAQKEGTLDPMSAIAAVLLGAKADANNPCGTGVKVYDGKRRYDLTFTYIRDEPVKLANGLPGGNAHLCQVHYDQIAGYKQKILDEGKAIPPMYADFVDVPAPGAPNGRYVVAARLWCALLFGTVQATLSQLKIDGAPVKGFIPPRGRRAVRG